MMVAPSGEQIQSLKNYMLLQKYCKLKYFSDFMSAVMLLFLFETLEDLGPKDVLKLPLKYLKGFGKDFIRLKKFQLMPHTTIKSQTAEP